MTKTEKIIINSCLVILIIASVSLGIYQHEKQAQAYELKPNNMPRKYIVIDSKNNRYGTTTANQQSALNAAKNAPKSLESKDNQLSILHANNKNQMTVYNQVGKVTKKGNTWTLKQDNDTMIQNQDMNVTTDRYHKISSKTGKFVTKLTINGKKLREANYVKWNGAHHWQKLSDNHGTVKKLN